MAKDRNVVSDKFNGLIIQMRQIAGFNQMCKCLDEYARNLDFIFKDSFPPLLGKCPRFLVYQ